jgi:hypothetical protein
MSGHSHKSISKLRRVICRVSSCKKSIVLQNYSDHLRSAHPAENFKDLRAAGDRGIASFGFTTTGSSEEGRGAAAERKERSRSPHQRLILLYYYALM